MNILWTLYLGILGTFLIGYLLKGKYKTFRNKMDFVISMVMWLGLFGYVTGTELFAPSFWEGAFIIGLLWDSVFLLLIKNDEYGGKKNFALWPRIAGLVPILPLYYGLFQYAY